MELIDVSIPLRSGVVGWPGDVPFEMRRRMGLEQGADFNISVINMSTHSGTHIDAPLHFISGARGVDAMPPEATVGPARIIEILDMESVKAGELEKHDIQPGERVILKTANSERPWVDLPFLDRYVYVSLEGAMFLAERGVRCVGVDYISIGDTDMKSSVPTHLALLEMGVWVIEGLYLAGVPAGPCELLCLPLRIDNADGAPARAFIGLPQG